jgi:hypothetical protein
MAFEALAIDLARAAAQLITGRLLTSSQIESISESLVGKLLSDWLPKPEEDRRAQSRVRQAQEHIAKASEIVRELKVELDTQATHLDVLMRDIELKRAKAEEYAALVNADEATVRAIRTQMEEAVRLRSGQSLAGD